MSEPLRVFTVDGIYYRWPAYQDRAYANPLLGLKVDHAENCMFCNGGPFVSYKEFYRWAPEVEAEYAEKPPA